MRDMAYISHMSLICHDTKDMKNPHKCLGTGTKKEQDCFNHSHDTCYIA